MAETAINTRIEEKTTLRFAKREWNVLANLGNNNFLCITKDIVCYKAFDDDGNNDWRKASARDWLNGEFLKDFDDVELVPQTQDLTADDGLTDYGNSTDKIFLLTADQYRKYRQNMDKVNDWWWLITPHSPTNIFVRNVDTSGALDAHSVYNGRLGLRPACVLHLPSIYDESEKQN